MVSLLVLRGLVVVLIGVSFHAAVAVAQQPATAKIEDITESGDEPKEVLVGIYIINVESINSADQSYKATVAIAMRWNDPTLICGSSDNPDEIRKFPVDKVWNPEVAIRNNRSAVQQFKKIVSVDCDGNVDYLQLFYGDFLTTANIRNFPFDKRTLDINLVSTEYDTDQLKFVANDEVTGRDEHFSIVDWKINAVPVTQSTYYYFEPQNLKFAAFTYKLGAERNYKYFILKIIIPLVFIVLMSLSVFWIPPTQLGPQIGLSVTSMLTLIAYLFAVGKVVPDVEYLTRFDKFVFGSTILVFLALVESIITGSLSASDKNRLAKRIDMYSRIIFPVVFVIVILYSFFLGY